jgi:hyaluronoglucosaminidase
VRFALVAVVLCAACRFDFDARTTDGSVPHDTGPVADSARDAYYDAVMADHPIAYWRLGDSAEVAKDELAAHDALFSGGVTEGQPGALAASPNRATAFNGMDGEAQTTKGISFATMQPFTIEIWIDETAPDTYWHFLTCEPRVLGMPQAGYALLQTPTGVMFERIPNPGQYDQTGTTLIQAGTWTHIAGVYDGTSVTLYVDGVAHQTAPAPEPADDFESPVFLGAHIDGAYFSGSLDEAAVYDRALSQQALLEHYTVATGN